jgi:protein TonB
MGNQLLTPSEPEVIGEPAASVARHSGLHVADTTLEEQGVFSSLWENLRDVFFPVHLPPLELTSTPIPVPDRMAVKRSPASIATSIFVNVALLALIFWLAYRVKVHFAPPKKTVIAMDLNTPMGPVAAEKMGGGGGTKDLTPVTHGTPPPPAKVQLSPPKLKPIDNPKLPAPVTIVMQDNLHMPTSDIFGDLHSNVSGPQSMGQGNGTGIGNGNGPGYGPGSGGNTGGGLYHIGGGISAPQLIYGPEAEFSDEARKAKFQGAVVVSCVVDVNGNAQQVRVPNPIGMGLDEKAIEAVKTYKFKPSMNSATGKPVPVMITIEVTFHIY